MNIYYAKTVLYGYKSLDAVMRQIDELVLKRALSSMADTSSCESQANKIISLTEQKDLLINLKIKTEEVMEKFTEEERDFFDYKYFKKKPKEYYIAFDSVSRAYFRRQIKLAEKFAKRLENAGITDEYFKKRCLKVDFLRELFKRVCERELLKPDANGRNKTGQGYSNSFSS